MLLPLLAMAACLAPVAQRPPQQRQEPQVDLVAEGHLIIAAAPAKDKNLWGYQVALLAMKQGRYSEARELWDRHLPPAGALLKGGASAQRARSLFQPEEAKIFFGEPHERTLAWFYRGVLHWMDGEPDNARACFRTAQLLDQSDESARQGDWVLLDYLDGFLTARQGGDGSDKLRRARAHAPGGASPTLPDYDTSANVMVVLQLGFGPLKRAEGRQGETLKWSGGHSTAKAALVRSGRQTVRAPALDDVSFQAATRGARRMDALLAQKANVKQATDTVGDLGLVPGLILAQSEGTRAAGQGLLVAAVAGKSVGGSVQPRADTRTWNNLPQHLAFAALRLPPGRHRLSVDFLDGEGNALPARWRELEVDVKPRGDTVLFVADP